MVNSTSSRTDEIKKWSDQCFSSCFPTLQLRSWKKPHCVVINSTSTESPAHQLSVDIPECYSQFQDVFCPKRASQLSPHRPWDCAINLLPGEPVPRGKIYPLTIPEQETMEKYIRELYNRVTSDHLPPLLLRASFSWQRRTEACGPV